MEQIENKPFLPGDQPVRTGPTKILKIEHYDTPFYGYGQPWDNAVGVEMFNDQARCKDKNLCSLTEASKLSDDKEFHAYAFALQIEFTDPSLYEIFVYYSKIEMYKQENIQNRLFSSRIGGGGGVGGPGDVNQSSFHLSNGHPLSNNLYVSQIPWIFPPGKTWSVKLTFMQLFGATAAQQPTAIWNADLDLEEKTRKLVRFIMLGPEYRDITT